MSIALKIKIRYNKFDVAENVKIYSGRLSL